MSSITDAVVSSQVGHTNQINETSSSSTSQKNKASGKTIGSPVLSEKASKYYEELKKKYSNMDFILVSEDQKNSAQSQAGNYANVNKMVVLIDEEKIEKMAEDENYRKQYEGIISNAASGLAQMGNSLASSGASVKGYGMQVNDNGTASFFAVIDKSLSTQKERIEKKAESKKESEKAAKKKAEKEEQQVRINKKNINKSEKSDTEDRVTITASSLEELLQKINDMVLANKSDTVQTEKEKKVGQSIDFSV